MKEKDHMHCFGKNFTGYWIRESKVPLAALYNDEVLKLREEEMRECINQWAYSYTVVDQPKVKGRPKVSTMNKMIISLGDYDKQRELDYNPLATINEFHDNKGGEHS